MSDHLPGCPVIALLINGNTVAAGSCICARLRACEERVRESWYEVQSETWEQGYTAGLDAAEAAVERAHDWYELSEGLEGRAMMKCDALAAIDALRKESND